MCTGRELTGHKGLWQAFLNGKTGVDMTQPAREQAPGGVEAEKARAKEKHNKPRGRTGDSCDQNSEGGSRMDGVELATVGPSNQKP